MDDCWRENVVFPRWRVLTVLVKLLEMRTQWPRQWLRTAEVVENRAAAVEVGRGGAAAVEVVEMGRQL